MSNARLPEGRPSGCSIKRSHESENRCLQVVVLVHTPLVQDTIAQLEERGRSKARVGGSNPPSVA